MQTGPEGLALGRTPSAFSRRGPADRSHRHARAEQRKQKRKQKQKDPTKYWFSTLPPETALERLVTLAHARWVIEQFYEDAKQECGLDHYQGRRWDGLHRHLALVMLAYSFLMLQRLAAASAS